MSELWYLFWHLSLIVVALIILMAVLTVFVMVKIMAGAQSAVVNEGYLGFDEPESPPASDHE